MRSKGAFWLIGIMLCLAQMAQAEPSGGKVDIISLRPYAGSVIYIKVSSATLCNTEMFTMDTSQVNGKEMYAAALAAVTTGKKVSLEVANATGCAGWGTKLQSIYLYP
jgi:hypothetical protein